MLPGFHCTTGFGRHYFFPFLYTLLHSPFQVTSRGPPTRISLAIYSHCHLSYPPVRSVSCDSTCTILDTVRHRHGKKEDSGQQQQTNSEKAPHGKGNRALGSFGVVFSPLTFLFLLLFFFFLCLSFSLCLPHSRSLPVVILGGRLVDCRLLGSHRRSGSSIQTE